jgi:hypothetical protein
VKLILNVDYQRLWQHAETAEEKSALIAEVMANLQAEGTVLINGDPWPTNGSLAYFSFADRRLDDADSKRSNYLVAAVNRETGYGSLVWYVLNTFPRSGGIHDYAWVSDNPEPPGFDPRVVADPDNSEFQEPRNTLPLPVIRAALEEFARTGTGDRPESIKWAPSGLTGKRLD